ncbi:MAG TPA: hypothetical protein VKY92_24325 [Verrucomicrobiae bacterium]|nr:hypothetical protein [Verrucomicrobiae bacterium]
MATDAHDEILVTASGQGYVRFEMRQRYRVYVLSRPRRVGSGAVRLGLGCTAMTDQN